MACWHLLHIGQKAHKCDFYNDKGLKKNKTKKTTKSFSILWMQPLYLHIFTDIQDGYYHH